MELTQQRQPGSKGVAAKTAMHAAESTAATERRTACDGKRVMARDRLELCRPQRDVPAQRPKRCTQKAQVRQQMTIHAHDMMT